MSCRGLNIGHLVLACFANGKNPISIISPCRRVIGSNGKLTGFAGGLGTKAHLLALEAPAPEGLR
jgi:O-6-methylguanine DNA methyltransferase